jgi:polysaccharide biosynthesis transport protein
MESGRNTIESSTSGARSPVTSEAPVVGASVARSMPGPEEYLRAVYRHRWLGLLTLVLVAAPLGLYGVLQPKAYEARIRVVLNPEPSAPVQFGDQAAVRSGSDERTQHEIIRSRDVARRTIVALRLWERPAFGAVGPAAATTKSGSPTRAELERAEALVPGFIARTKVIPIPLSRLVDVVFEAPEADVAAAVVNELGRQFIQHDLEARAQSSSQAAGWLEERLREQRRKVEESDAALHRYQERRNSVSVEGRQNIVVERLSDLNAGVTKAKSERMLREATFEQVRQAGNDPAVLDSIPAIAASVEVRQLHVQVGDLRRQDAELARRYGDLHPMRVKLATAIEATERDRRLAMAKAAEVIKNEYLAAMAQERSLTQALDAQKGEALRLNQQDLEYGRLQREAEANRQIFNALSQQAQQASIAGEFKTSPIRILDVAQPPTHPVRPQRTKFVALSLTIGLFCALAVALGRELLDARIKTPQEVMDLLRIPFLGLVPAMQGKPGSHGDARFQTAPSPFSDALRRIRATLLLSTPNVRPITLLVTSTGPQEGKTTMSVGLAQCLAAGVQRVLIIDTDLRRPSVHTQLGRKTGPGLAEYLAGKARIDEILVHTETKHLSAIFAGRVPQNPSELLGQPRFAELLAMLKLRFDWIVLDSAPILSVPDAALLARSASGILFVVGAQMASRQAVQRAQEELSRAGVPFAGSVLNKADVTRHAYYYAPYYNAKYESYYRVEA